MRTTHAIIFLVHVLVAACDPIEIQVIQTAKFTGDRLTQKPSIYFTSTAPYDTDVTIKIDPTTQYQIILGFGGAFTEAAAYTYSLMNSEIQEQILEAYWGPTGQNYSIGRVHMNSCDFCLQSYSFDDYDQDWDLTNFNISHEFLWHIPFIKDAMGTSEYPIKLFLTPWSPPAWMKTNGQMDGSGVPGLKPDSQYHSTWALYFSKFITAYAQQGIPFWGLTVQNEPEFAAPWEACVYAPEDERDFIKNFLGPQMERDHPEITIMIYDHNKDHIVDWVSTILSDPDAAQYIDGTGFHWYTGPQFENVVKAHQLYPDKFLLATEACTCPVNIGDWNGGESYGYDIIGDLNSFAVGWTDWNLVLDTSGGPNHLNGSCNAPIICDTENQTIWFNPSYYYMGQISRYVSPGSIRIDLAGTNTTNISYTGFISPSDQVVVVTMNQNDQDADITLTTGGLYAQYTLPSHGIVTFVYDVFSR